MSLRTLVARLAGLGRPRRFHQDLHDQITAHLDEATEDYVRRGLSPVEARRAALRSFGSVVLAEESSRDVRGRTLEHLARNVRDGWRALWRRPSFAAVAILSLALGLGVNAATFGMFDSLVLRPFAIPHVDRLVLPIETSAQTAIQRWETVAAGNFREWPDQATSLQHFAAFTTWNVNLSGGNQPERIAGQRVTASFFSLLGITPAVGRLLQERDETWGQHHQIVISDGLWRRRFGADPGIVGTTVQADGEPYEIVGVTLPGFDFPLGSEAWSPLALESDQMLDRSQRFLTVIAGLRPGANLGQANTEMAAIYARQQHADPDATRGRHVVVRGLTDGLVDIGTPTVLGLQQAGSLFVLLIVCTNVASLLLAHGAGRRRELAVRLALGASRGQLIRQLLIENLVLAIAAVPLALAVAWAVIHVVQASLPASLVRFAPGWTEMAVSGRVIAFTVAASCLTTVVFGLLPALTISRVVPTATLKDGGRSITTGRTRSRLRRGFVVAQLTLVLPLLVASGLTAIAAHRFTNGPQGFNPSGTYQFRLALPSATYPDAAARAQFAERLLDRARTVPGVTTVALTTLLPSTSSRQLRQVSIDGLADDPDVPRVVNYRAISPGYFDTMQIPVLAGRAIAPVDRYESQPVSIVSESFVRRYLPMGSPLGRRVRLGATGDHWTTVVGVSGDTIDDWFSTRHEPTIFVSFAQFPSATVTLVGRTSGDATQLAGGLRRALAAVDPMLPDSDGMTVQDLVSLRTTGLRFIAATMAALGGLALLLSALGIYGVMAQFVADRRHEFGVRMALGASARDVLRLTVRQSAMLTAAGIALGLSAAIGLARLMEGALFGIVAIEWPLVVSIAVLLAAIALLATVVPARRAMSVDPALVLRE